MQTIHDTFQSMLRNKLKGHRGVEMIFAVLLCTRIYFFEEINGNYPHYAASLFFVTIPRSFKVLFESATLVKISSLHPNLTALNFPRFEISIFTRTISVTVSGNRNSFVRCKTIACFVKIAYCTSRGKKKNKCF